MTEIIKTTPKELVAMQEIKAVLKPLSPQARKRVLLEIMKTRPSVGKSE